MILTTQSLFLSAGFLLILHLGANFGLRPRAFSASESFVLGHWPFLFLNLLILHFTGGFDWTALNRFDPDSLATAQLVAALGLASFLLGGLIAVTLQRTGRMRFLETQAPVETTARVAVFLTILGLAATIPNVIAMASQGPAARSTILLALGHFLVPGGLLCFVVARDRSFRKRTRWIFFALCVASMIVLAFNWSRRPLVVTVAAVLMLMAARRKGYFGRWLFAALLPLLMLLAAGALVWRDVFVHGQEIYSVSDIANHYTNALWLESSAFSALMLVVDTHRPLQMNGDNSLLLPFIFWIPRAIFPEKPSAFDPGIALGTPYSIGPSIYGEVLVNVTVIGLVPFMMLLGLFLKWIDLIAARRRLQDSAAALYALLILDAIFLVRGSFHTMFTPMLLHFLIPLFLFSIDKTLAPHFGSSWKKAIHGETG